MALGAGGILSSANDMAKYMNFHLNLGRVNTTQVIPEVGTDENLSSHCFSKLLVNVNKR